MLERFLKYIIKNISFYLGWYYLSYERFLLNFGYIIYYFRYFLMLFFFNRPSLILLEMKYLYFGDSLDGNISFFNFFFKKYNSIKLFSLTCIRILFFTLYYIFSCIYKVYFNYIVNVKCSIYLLYLLEFFIYYHYFFIISRIYQYALFAFEEYILIFVFLFLCFCLAKVLQLLISSDFIVYKINIIENFIVIYDFLKFMFNFILSLYTKLLFLYNDDNFVKYKQKFRFLKFKKFKVLKIKIISTFL